MYLHYHVSNVYMCKHLVIIGIKYTIEYKHLMIRCLHVVFKSLLGCNGPARISLIPNFTGRADAL